ncbi:MAG TPA: hypothetical protein VK304_00895 [Thermoleophilaceae bacterium]|nr:hypothetical protein [Thermoleophilaceae bacterium]
MRATDRRRERLIIGAGGVLLIGSLFLPWADAGGARHSGWDLWTMADIYLTITGIVAIWAAITGGRFGLFRPDLSLNGATDLLGVVATVLLTWLVAFDYPDAAAREVGVFVALAAAVAVMGGAGDYGTLRGESPFPPTAAGGQHSKRAWAPSRPPRVPRRPRSTHTSRQDAQAAEGFSEGRTCDARRATAAAEGSRPYARLRPSA